MKKLNFYDLDSDSDSSSTVVLPVNKNLPQPPDVSDAPLLKSANDTQKRPASLDISVASTSDKRSRMVAADVTPQKSQGNYTLLCWMVISGDVHHPLT